MVWNSSSSEWKTGLEAYGIWEHVITVWKYGNAESLEDEFKALKVKIQDQLKLELTKIHLKDLALKVGSEKLNDIDQRW